MFKLFRISFELLIVIIWECTRLKSLTVRVKGMHARSPASRNSRLTWCLRCELSFESSMKTLWWRKTGRGHAESGKKKRLLWMPHSDYSRCVISMTLQEHKVSRCVCCYWSVSDDLVFSASGDTVNTHFQGRGGRKSIRCFHSTNATIVLGGWRQSTTVKRCVKAVWFARN